MPDLTIEELRTELDRQREEQEARHQALLDHLSRDDRPLTQAEVNRTMANGYAAEADRRSREAIDAAAEDAEDGAA